MRRDNLKQTLLLFAAPAALCLTAGVQRYLAETHNLNPWKGGGFGMFASLDMNLLRVLSVTTFDTDGKKYRVDVPTRTHMREQERAIKQMPTQTRIDELARRLAETEWVVVQVEKEGEPWQYAVSKDDYSDLGFTRPLMLRAIMVEIWQYHLDPATFQLRRSRLYQATVRVGDN